MQDSDKNSTPQGEEKEDQPDLSAKAESEAVAANQEREARRVRARKETREWIVSIAVALIAVFLIRSFLFTIIRVDGDSMKETLHNGERLIVTVLVMVYLLANLLVDVLYAALDPRIRDV